MPTEKTADGKSLNSINPLSKYNDPEYVRVSDVLKVISKGSRMVRWYYKFKDYKEMMESLRLSAKRGSDVDNAVKELLSGVEIEPNPAIKEYLRAFSKWQDEWRFKAILRDEEVFDTDLKYVGTLDLYGSLNNPKSTKNDLVVIDIKTGEPGRDKDGNKIYETYSSMHQQTAAYASAVTKMGRKVTGTYILRLFSDGNYLFEPDKDPKKSFEIFKAALTIRRLGGKIE